MKTKAILGVLALAGLTLAGCAATYSQVDSIPDYYRVVRIPDTPDGLAAYRQCATTPHFSQAFPCLAGIPEVNDSGWLENNSLYSLGTGCRQIIADSYYSDGVQRFYSIQACQDTATPNQALQSQTGQSQAVPSIFDSSPVLKIDHAQP